jgi:mannose-6-phosphate isomerase-like protein (cupin superfamily)
MIRLRRICPTNLCAKPPIYLGKGHLVSENMLSFLRATAPPRLNRADCNPVTYEDGASAIEFIEEPGQFFLRNTHPPYNKDDPSLVNPPLHYHIHQTEHFRVCSGEVNLYRDHAEEPWKVLGPDGSTASVPNAVYHTLRNASTRNPLVLDVGLTPEDKASEERFFRNFFGYLDDCKRAKQEPSLFQLMVFLRHADTPLGLPLPTQWLRLAGSRAFTNIMGLIGEWVLGYQPSYSEYYLPRKGI